VRTTLATLMTVLLVIALATSVLAVGVPSGNQPQQTGKKTNTNQHTGSQQPQQVAQDPPAAPTPPSENVTMIPEPATFVLLGLGLVTAAAVRRLRRA